MRFLKIIFLFFSSHDGKYLCSQAGEPDQTLIIWDWKKSKIVLKVKSHTQDVHICRFSTYIPNHIVTAGSGHIKFWKMANTFTGLKLKGQLGRFGKTEVSNVVGVLSMPDEKVKSLVYTHQASHPAIIACYPTIASDVRVVYCPWPTRVSHLSVTSLFLVLFL